MSRVLVFGSFRNHSATPFTTPPELLLVMDEFRAAVKDILESEPDGLRSLAIWQRVNAHSDYDLTVPMKDFHGQLGELCRESVIDRIDREKRYRLTA